jgi:CMP-N-acetylneuraminic acid synthetase
MKRSILCIIPARCGSKGIIDKNIIDVCGKPLIAYSIESALKLQSENLIAKVIVSTDCEKIASVAKEYGADIPFLRPDELSHDKSKSIDFMIHALAYFDNIGEKYDTVLLLQPTSPIRSFYLLKQAIDTFNNSNNDSLISCYKEEYINDLVMYKIDSENTLKPMNKYHNKGVRRQDHGEVFVRNGSIYITKTDYLKNTGQIISDEPLLIEMKKSDSINIDTMEDLILLRNAICK